MITYISKEGETVDFICWKYYGFTDRLTVEQVLNANPGLADNAIELAAGISIVMPDLSAPAAVQGVKLWT